jgi:hypothetical protein
LGAASGPEVGLSIAAGLAILSAQAVIPLKKRAANNPNLRMPSQSPLTLIIRLAKRNGVEEVPRQFALGMNKIIRN